MEMGRDRKAYKFNLDDMNYVEEHMPNSFIMSERVEHLCPVIDKYTRADEFEIDGVKFALYRIKEAVH